MRRLIVTFILLCLLSCPIFATAEEAQARDAPMLLFYAADCWTCHEMKAYFDELMTLNPELPLKML